MVQIAREEKRREQSRAGGAA
jgi:hypothetical protein